MLCSSVLGSATEFVSESFKFIVLLELPQSWILEMVGWGQSDKYLFLSCYRLLGKGLELFGV